MIKQKTIQRPCKALRRDVRLSALFREDDSTGWTSPCMIQGCDSRDQCRVRSGASARWTRCPFYGEAV